MYEVELKFPLTDPADVITRLSLLGARKQLVVTQSDLYFNHPARDFAVTNEALRIRTSDNEVCVTFKGPLVDTQTKTRREIEIGLERGSTTAAQFRELLELLGFRPVLTVTKQRTPYLLDWQQRKFEVVLDDVSNLGKFLEVETLADESDREPARDAILTLATRLGLSNAERRSYLSLLLEQQQSP